MDDARTFVYRLAVAGKAFKEIKETVDAAFGEKTLQRAQIYNILKEAKAGNPVSNQRGRNKPKEKRTPQLIADVDAAVQEDGRVTIRELAATFGVGVRIIHRILHEDLGLSKKSARWVPKLLNTDQKQERVRICQNFVTAIRRHKLDLDNIVTMDETMVSQHTPETKKQSKRWVKKGQPGPIKARVHASRSKHMVLAFFDAGGLIYTNIVPKGQTVNAAYIVKTLDIFLKNMRTKRPQMVERGFQFHWDNAPVHTAVAVKNWFAAHSIPLLEHPPYSPDLAPADFFLFPKVKEMLAGHTLTAGGVKTAWEGVTRTIAKEDYATAFRRWYERAEKCVEIGGEYIEKN